MASQYSAQEHLACFSYFCFGKTLREIAEEREPSFQTLARWSTEESWEARRATVNERALEQAGNDIAHKKAEFVTKVWATIPRLMSDLLDDERLDRASVSQMTTAIGTLVDKALLLSGEATQRSEVVSSDDARDKLTRIIGRMSTRSQEAGSD